MKVSMEPARIVLRPGGIRVVHDVGEFVEIPTAEGLVHATVTVRDARTGAPLDAELTVAGQPIPANQPFERLFRAEWNAQTGRWSRELIISRYPGYDSTDVPYEVEVETGAEQCSGS